MDYENIEVIEDLPEIEILDEEPCSEIEVIEEVSDDGQEFDLAEDKEFEPIVVSDWETPKAFEEYIVASSRQRPQIFKDSRNSLRRAWHYYANLQNELLSGIASDANYGALSKESLTILDSIEEGIELSLEQLAENIDNKLMKTATKSSQFTYVVSPFLFGLARTLINGKTSQGKNIEDLFEEINKKYKLTDREQFELKWILNDMGYPIRSSFVDGIDMMEQYHN